MHRLVQAQEEKSQEEKKKEEKTPVITEEILAVGEAPKDRPLLSLKRLSFDEKDVKVCYRYGESSKEVERMEYLKFIARVVSHIPTRVMDSTGGVRLLSWRGG